MQSAYRELYDQRMGGGRFNAAFQRLGQARSPAGGRRAVPRHVHLQRARTTRSSSCSTGRSSSCPWPGRCSPSLLSLFLSRNITHPIAELLGAMGRIRDGALETQVRTRGGHEIGRLFRGVQRHGARARAEPGRHAQRPARDRAPEGIQRKDRELDPRRASRSSTATSWWRRRTTAFLDPSAWTPRGPSGRRSPTSTSTSSTRRSWRRSSPIFRRESEFHSQMSSARATGRVYEIRLYPFYSAEGGFQRGFGLRVHGRTTSAPRRELEEKIFQAEKLSTISMLSAGMAHEINNPLGSILTNVQNLIDEETNPERRVSLKWIEQETRRIARIVQELLNFASADSGHAPGLRRQRRRPGGGRPHGPFAGRARSRIRIDTRLAPGLPAVGREHRRAEAGGDQPPAQLHPGDHGRGADPRQHRGSRQERRGSPWRSPTRAPGSPRRSSRGSSIPSSRPRPTARARAWGCPWSTGSSASTAAPST